MALAIGALQSGDHREVYTDDILMTADSGSSYIVFGMTSGFM